MAYDYRDSILTHPSDLRINEKHPYHLVDPSPHPFVASLGGLGLTFGGVLYFHGYSGGKFLMFFGFFTIIFVMFV
jgi:hypothetical protein